MKPNRKTLTVLALVALLLLAATVSASVPRMISYQGKATDASGNPVPDGDYQVRFYIYDHPTAGNAIWMEAFFTVHTTGGLFTHLLGSRSPIPDSVFADHDSLYLAVMFNFEWQTPRTPLVSSGYAFRVNSLDGANGGTVNGTVTLHGTTNIVLNPSADGNGSVTLPDGAIGAREISDEPGIACATDINGQILDTGSAQDILTVSLTIPAGGYIVVEAKFHGSAAGASGSSNGWVQIDETSGGNGVNPYRVKFGKDLAGPMAFPGYASRIFYKLLPGTYTFRLEGASFNYNCFGCSPSVENIILMARYYPTAYGTVSSLVSGDEASEFQNAKPVSVDGQTIYEVDLRELELRAAKKQAEADEARIKLLEAQAKQASQSPKP